MQEYIVTELDIAADGKLAKKVQEQLRDSNPQLSSVVVSQDDDGER